MSHLLQDLVGLAEGFEGGVKLSLVRPQPLLGVHLGTAELRSQGQAHLRYTGSQQGVVSPCMSLLASAPLGPMDHC